MPDDYKLEQNYPNPFNPTTTINFTLPISKAISVKIYNGLGQEVRSLINNKPYAAGTHSVQWDATDNNGKAVASGVYIYKLIYGNFSKSKRMTFSRSSKKTLTPSRYFQIWLKTGSASSSSL